MDTNQISGFVRILLGSFGANHPLRLALGISLGLGVKILIHAGSRMYPDTVFMALNEFGAAWYIAILCGGLFWPVVFNKRSTPEGIISQIDTVDELIRRAHLGPSQAQILWHSLITKYLEALKPDLSEAPNLRDIIKDAEKDLTVTPPASGEEPERTSQ